MQHLKKDNVVWILFRMRREALGYEREEVANIIKCSLRNIFRIESGYVLSSPHSYIISQLLTLYQFNDQEVEVIRWYICLFKDMITLTKKYDRENVIDK